MSIPSLTEAQARVVASLVEKAVTTPKYYPMTVNAITAACNQKSCRNPSMKLSEGEVGAALNHLEREGFCRRVENTSRTIKWRHQFNHQTLLDTPSVALLATLMLRGPQTASELRSNAAGLKGPTDNDSLQQCLERLGDGPDPFVVLLPRAAGQKESRYAHRLCGEPENPPADAAPAPAASSRSMPDLLARIEALEARVETLERAATQEPTQGNPE